MITLLLSQGSISISLCVLILNLISNYTKLSLNYSWDMLPTNFPRQHKINLFKYTEHNLQQCFWYLTVNCSVKGQLTSLVILWKVPKNFFPDLFFFSHWLNFFEMIEKNWVNSMNVFFSVIKQCPDTKKCQLSFLAVLNKCLRCLSEILVKRNT